MLADDAGELALELDQAIGNGFGLIERDHAVRDVQQPIAGAGDDTPAEATRTRIDSDSNHGNQP